MLVDGSIGKMAWVPVTVGSETYVVLSIPVADYMIKTTINIGGVDIKSFLSTNLKRHSTFRYGSETDSEFRDIFCQIMLKTPFKPYKMSARTWAKTNLSNYVIMSQAYFKSLIDEIKKTCKERPLHLNSSIRGGCLRTCLMTSDFSLFNGDGGEGDCKVDIEYASMKSTDKKMVTYEERMTMPAMGVCMWSECYSVGFVDYFNMTTDGEGNLGHVVDGVYVPAQGNTYARSYEQVLEKLGQNLAAGGKKRRTRAKAVNGKKGRGSSD